MLYGAHDQLKQNLAYWYYVLPFFILLGVWVEIVAGQSIMVSCEMDFPSREKK
jgi:hypothetical protein